MNPWLFVVVAGSANLKFAPTWQVQNIYRFIPHQEFHFRTMINDIGLIQLIKPFHVTNYVRFIRLPRARVDLRENHICSTMGWGDTKMINAPKILREVWLPLMANEECEKYLGGELPMQQMCAGKKEGGVDACQVWEIVHIYTIIDINIGVSIFWKIINKTDCPFFCLCRVTAVAHLFAIISKWVSYLGDMDVLNVTHQEFILELIVIYLGSTVLCSEIIHRLSSTTIISFLSLSS
ncbi:chymotrypsin-like protease CTRL-1 isoform X1 [Cotesia glomerata]|uniref:chymotrypsin-like protease CTRL-1 isoform X1 n=1 Tax=Cotesia glomerata TaxID=32391 RepID=UPI001D00849D|nr:chymotrypsin-like protease CTRL-1 isoform X1 [Cotesia glomerata]